MKRLLPVVLVLSVSGCGGSEEATTVTETVTETATVTETVETSPPERQEGFSVEGFEMPSGNIGCVVALEEGYSFMRCTISEVENPPERPDDCDLEWGNVITMGPDGPAGWACVGDVLPPDNPPETFAYGETWRRGAFECRSMPRGLRCENEGHWFFLSRVRQSFGP